MQSSPCQVWFSDSDDVFHTLMLHYWLLLSDAVWSVSVFDVLYEIRTLFLDA